MVEELEIWESISGFEGIYEISNLGRIKTLPRPRPLWNGVYLSKEKILKTHKNKITGYITVGLHDNFGNYKRLYVHRLVATAFLENPHNKKDVNHIDGNKTNNRVSNLEWATRSENKLHAFRTGITVSKKGERSSNAKLTSSKVVEIKSLLDNSSYTLKEVADKFGVSKEAISGIKKGRNWGYL